MTETHVELSTDSFKKLCFLMDDLDVSKTESFTITDGYGNRATFVKTEREGDYGK